MAKTSDAQKKATERYRKKNRKKTTVDNYKRSAKLFIRNHAGQEDLNELKELIKQKENEIMKEQNLIEELKNNYDVIGGLEDVYYQPSTKTFWLVESGMAYSGDDPDAVEIAQIEDGEIIRTTVEFDEVEF